MFVLQLKEIQVDIYKGHEQRQLPNGEYCFIPWDQTQYGDLDKATIVTTIIAVVGIPRNGIIFQYPLGMFGWFDDQGNV